MQLSRVIEVNVKVEKEEKKEGAKEGAIEGAKEGEKDGAKDEREGEKEGTEEGAQEEEWELRKIICYHEKVGAYCYYYSSRIEYYRNYFYIQGWSN